jgi:predicted TIM-barrel fold metal-dependent hydrolase
MNKPFARGEIFDPLKVGIFDCDIHPTVKKPTDIRAYLPERWRRHFDDYGDFIRQPFVGALSYPKATRALSRLDSWPPGGGGPGSDLDFMRAQHLDANGVSKGVLQVLWPVGNKQRNRGYAAAMCAAINDWQMDQWTSREPRLKGSIVVPQEETDLAVAEIERVGDSSDFAQLLLSPRAEEPLGRRRYWPLYEAAVARDLPVTFHVGGVNGRPPTAGIGHPSFYAEEHQSHVQYMQGLVANLIFEGVFDEFPTLRVLIIESGLAWAPALGWRLDEAWRRLGSGVPHVKRPPSEYLREHFWFSTQPADEPQLPSQLRDVFDWIGWNRILFATDYPHWDFDDPRHAFKMKLSETERFRVYWANAHEAYGSRVA